MEKNDYFCSRNFKQANNKINMNSVLEGRPALKKEVEKIAEVAGYLWQNGWAERNGGNITVNITDLVDDEIKALPAISEVKQIGTALPALKGCYFFCKGTGKRMRDLARWPMENGSIIRILDDCASYVIIADNAVMPTSELPSHLSVHARLIEKGSNYKATVHTHPIELIAEETLKELEDYDVVMWEKHGVFAKGLDVMDAFDQIDVLSKSAKIYIDSKCMGFEPDGMSQEEMAEMTKAFNLPR